MKVHYIKNDMPHNEAVIEYNEKIRGLESHDIHEANIIVCGGGDGTLLKCIAKYRSLDKIFYGYNAGRVGYLMNKHITPPENVYVKELRLINTEITTENGLRYNFQAFNDVIITASNNGTSVNSWIEFFVEEKDDIYGSFFGGGLCISTPQGSTGYNKNNFGKVLPLDSELWSITGIACQHDRNINQVLEPRYMKFQFKSRSRIVVHIDGSVYVIKDVKNVCISQGDFVKVAFSEYEEFNKKRRR